MTAGIESLLVLEKKARVVRIVPKPPYQCRTTYHPLNHPLPQAKLHLLELADCTTLLVPFFQNTNTTPSSLPLPGVIPNVCMSVCPLHNVCRGD